MDKVYIIQKVSQYEGKLVIRAFRKHSDACNYIQKMYPKADKDKDGDWVINHIPEEKEWISISEVDVY